MNDKPKYAPEMAHALIQSRIQKPFWGKPHVLTGAYWEISSALFQQFSLLGRLFQDNPEPFFYVLTAENGKELGLLNYMKSVIDKDILELAYEASTSMELLLLREKLRVNSTEDIAVFYSKNAMVKLPPDKAAENAAFWGVHGASFGLNYPDIVEDQFEAIMNIDPEVQKEAYELGLNIAPEQTIFSIDQATREAVRHLREFTEQFYPEFFEE